MHKENRQDGGPWIYDFPMTVCWIIKSVFAQERGKLTFACTEGIRAKIVLCHMIRAIGTLVLFGLLLEGLLQP